MKKISVSRAIELINLGIYPKCMITSKEEDSIFVNSVSKLYKLKRLGDFGAQKFELFEVDQTLKIPPEATEVSFDQAFILLDDHEPHLIYAIDSSMDSPTEISTRNEIISFCRSRSVRGEKFAFYKID